MKYVMLVIILEYNHHIRLLRSIPHPIHPITSDMNETLNQETNFQSLNLRSKLIAGTIKTD